MFVLATTNRSLGLFVLAGILLVVAAVVFVRLAWSGRRPRPVLKLENERAMIDKEASKWGVSPRTYLLVEYDVMAETEGSDERDELVAVARMHPAYLIPYVLGPLLLAFCCLIAAAFLWGFTLHQDVYDPTQNRTVHQTVHPPLWLLAMVIALALIATSWYSWCGWAYSFRVITDRRYIIMRSPPWWVPMSDQFVDLTLNRVGTVKNRKSFQAKLLGIDVGSVDAGSNEGNEEDALFRTKWNARPREWSKLLRSAKQDYVSRHPEVREA